MDKALVLAYHFLKFRMRTVWEMRQHLEQKAERYRLSQKDIEDCIQHLIDEQFLDDAKFVEAYVHTRTAVKPKGTTVLRQELLRLGVDKGVIDPFFAENPIDEELLARTTLARKLKTLHTISDEKKRFQKAVSFLQRRGYSFDLAKRVYAEAFN
jgi:regulatory protein